MAKGIWYGIHTLETRAFIRSNNDNLADHFYIGVNDAATDTEWAVIEATGYTTSGDLVAEAKLLTDITTGLGANGIDVTITNGQVADTYVIHSNANFAKTLKDSLASSSWSPVTGLVTIGSTPYYIYFSHRSNGILNATPTYAPLAHIGGLGAGGITTGDPTNVGTGDPRFALLAEAGTFSNMEVLTQDGTGPGVGETATYSLQVNGAVSTMSCVVSGAATTGSDTTHDVVVTNRSLVCLVVTFSAGAVINGYTGRVLFTPS